jgi:hypothetical protein
MIRKIQRHWFEVWGQEEAQNRFLKYLLLVMSGLVGILLVTVCCLALRNTPVLVLDPETSLILFPKAPDGKALERELIRLLKKYLTIRHNWDPVTIEDQSKKASFFVASEFREKYLLSSQEQIRLSKEKQVAQRLFTDDPDIDIKNKKATVRAERILIINGIRASQPMLFELSFDYGERTANNPEGIYITGEKLTTPTGS